MRTHQVSHSKISALIPHILQQMSLCIAEQESIIDEEREAMTAFNAQALANLVERRARSQSTLQELESQCAQLSQDLEPTYNTETRMAHLIDHYVPEGAADLHSLRIELVRRIQALGQNQVENHTRLRAAWNVTTGILQSLGALEAKTTYKNNTYAPVSR